MKKLGIVITDGVGFRNFIMSDFIKEASLKFDAITIYSGLPKHAYANVSHLAVTIKELDVFKEGYSTWFFRKWKEVAHLQKHQSFFGMKDNLDLGYPSTHSLRALLTKLIYVGTRFIHSEASILLVEKLQFLSISRNKITKSYIQLLEHDQPTHLFFTHQRPPYVAPILYAAQQLKLKVHSAQQIGAQQKLSQSKSLLHGAVHTLNVARLHDQEYVHN